MIVDFDKASEYTRKLLKINNEKILEIKKYGEENKIPIITEEVLNFMIFSAKTGKAANILEIGTAIGYSGIFLADIDIYRNLQDRIGQKPFLFAPVLSSL